ncbi:MAG: mechanosensitive ion channel [Alphaproteobacteria bacterium]|nr:mechanosensitive ion channel [Alphaproteobacteria bacterium]
MIAIGIMVGALILAKLARRLVERIGLSRAPLRREVLRILSSLAYFVIMAMGVATALGTLGIDVAALVAGAGLAGLALGLALKDPIGNAVAGLMMLYFEPFRVGDRIAILGIHGQVDDIDLRYTRIATDKEIVLVPNTMLLTSTISVER